MEQIGKSVCSLTPRSEYEPQGEVHNPRLPRKASKEIYINPYRKPTQVDEERILRRLEKLQLRNSAKWNRNFGIRFALCRKVTC